MKQTTTKTRGTEMMKMMNFTSLRSAANFVLRADFPMFVFDGPSDDYVVATPKQSKRLQDDGHVPFSMSELSKATAQVAVRATA